MIGRTARFAAREIQCRRIFWRYRNFTMVPSHVYVGNLRLASRIKDVPGAIVECGTWRGGMIAGIADVLGPDRHYHLFDSFEGLPPAQEVDGEAAQAWQADRSSPRYHNNCSASEAEARTAMARSSAKRYDIVKGWFDQTLPNLKLTEPIALLRVDADWYESTRCVLDHLSSHVAPGGMIIVDDYYYWEGCTKAVNEVAAANNWRIRQYHYGDVCFIRI